MSAIPSRLLALLPADRLQLETWLAEFEQDWDGDRLAAHVGRLPAPGHPLRLPAFIELVKIDLERQWQAGHRFRVADYLLRYPELAHPGGPPPDLLMTEEEVVRQFGADAPTVLAPDLPPTLRPDVPHPAGAPHVPGYEILGQLGQGGMGAVFRGHDATLDRDVAVKVLLKQHRGHADAERRFVREARICGQLQHPGVVPVYGLGRADDARPAFIMKVVEGRTLANLLDNRKSPADDLPRLLTIFEQVCQAVAYAHSKGVIHRDLKPANVMVGAFGEVQVMDWGLAKVLVSPERQRPENGAAQLPDLGSQPGSTVDELGTTGTVGTPQYMPPEQARGEAANADERADVFGLGAILCEILSGQPPFVAGDSAEVLAKAALGQLGDAFSRLDGCGADGELVALCKACLARHAADRPRDGGAVAARVAAYRAAVQERLREADLERAAALARAAEAKATAAAERKARQRTVALAVAGVLVAAGVGAAAVWEQHRRETVDQLVRGRLKEAELLSERAQNAATLADLDNATRARLAAVEAEDRARGSSASESLRRQAADLARQLASEENEVQRDQQLLLALLEVRGPEQGPLAPRDGRMSLAVQVGPTADQRFAAAFRAWDESFDVDSPMSEALALRLQSRAPVVKDEIIAALDEWAAERRQRGRPAADWEELAQRLSSEAGQRRKLLRGLATGTLTRVEARDARARTDVAQAPVTELLTLARALQRVGEAAEAELVLREAVRARPQEAALHNALGKQLEAQQPPRWRDAVDCYVAAQALRPEWGEPLAYALVRSGRAKDGFDLYAQLIARRPTDAWLYFRRGNARYEQADYAGAAEDYAEVIRQRPRDVFLAHNSRGTALFAQGRLQDAEVVFQEALTHKADLAEAHANMGAALLEQGCYQEAEAECREAIRIQPGLVQAHNNLGVAVFLRGRPMEAEGEFREAIRVNPAFTRAYANLGAALERQGKWAEAEAECRQAIRLQPGSALAHANLGNTLYHMGRERRREAEAAFREAIRLDEHSALAYAGLGATLLADGRPGEAESACRTALRHDENLPAAHRILGRALHDQGQMAAAVTALQLALARKAGDRFNLIPEYERDAALERRLPALFAGTDEPANAAERLDFAKVCQWKGLYVAAARLSAQAFAAEPKLAEDLDREFRYDAACCAVQAAAGLAGDDPALPDRARRPLRRQALAWLRADLARYVGDSTLSARVPGRLRHWLAERDFASVHDDRALLALPDDELLEWRRLWQDVAALLAKAERALLLRAGIGAAGMLRSLN
jgi:serine/threonine-protein kinase